MTNIYESDNSLNQRYTRGPTSAVSRGQFCVRLDKSALSQLIEQYGSTCVILYKLIEVTTITKYGFVIIVFSD